MLLSEDPDPGDSMFLQKYFLQLATAARRIVSSG
jgi:hypothetical protein